MGSRHTLNGWNSIKTKQPEFCNLLERLLNKIILHDDDDISLPEYEGNFDGSSTELLGNKVFEIWEKSKLNCAIHIQRQLGCSHHSKR